MSIRQPKVLVYDVETTPIIGYTWGLWNTNVIEVIEPSHLLCFAYKWGHEDTDPKVVSLRQFKRSYKRNRRDDYMVVKKLRKLFDEADVVVAHNGDGFDQKKAQARMAFHGLSTPSPYLSVDTLKVARKEFKIESNKLDYLGDYFGVGRKAQTGGFSTWTGCMDGDDASWQKMEDYNKQDVTLLESVYGRLRDGGWVKTGPNMALISGDYEACPRCGTYGFLVKRGTLFKATVAYQKVQCMACNSYSSERKIGTGPRYA